MNEPMIDATKRAIISPQFVSIPGQCQHFVRQVVESVYGSRFAEFNHGGDAIEASFNWMTSPFALKPDVGSLPGDILYYTHNHGPHGHVVIRLPGNVVGENSSIHSGPHGAKGTRPIEALGVPSLIVRLPPP